jgi:hypothetical protein
VPEAVTLGVAPAARAGARRPHAIERPRERGILASRSGRPVSRPRRWARAVWFSVAVAVNELIAAWAAWRGGVLDHAVEASLVTLLIAVAARHDGIARCVFVLGRWVRSYRLHQLTYHLGQLHRAMATAATAWFAVALAAGATSGDAAGRALGLAALVILVAMMSTARDAPATTGSRPFTATADGPRWRC